MSKVIELSNISFAYTEQAVLKDINLVINAEEFIGIIGPNAAGKTTLVKILLGLLQPQSGQVSVLGKAPVEVNHRIGYVGQKPAFNPSIPIPVRDVVLMGRVNKALNPGLFRRHDYQQVNDILKILQIEHLADKQLSQLSGGQLQRVWIARALVSSPEILILDEPTANIDIKAEEDIFALLKQYNSHMTILVVSHDIAFISSYVDRVACVNQTLVCHDVESISGKTIEELYGTDVKMIQHIH